MSRRRFDGVIQFPFALPVQTEALGERITVRVGSRQMTLGLPVASADVPGQWLESPLGGRGQVVPEALQPAMWGYVTTRGRAYVMAVRTSVLLEPSENLWAAADFNEVTSSLAPWFELVRSWAEAWMRVPLVLAADPERPAIRVAPPGGQAVHSPGQGSRTIIVVSEHLSGAQTRGAFARASKGLTPPPAHSLASAARRAMFERDARRAVIEAGTAVEVALSSVIAERLQAVGTPEEFIRKVLLGANGMMGLYDLSASLGHTPPVSKRRLQTELAEPRNIAAHQGRAPDDEQVRKAVAHASAVVLAALPLPLA